MIERNRQTKAGGNQSNDFFHARDAEDFLKLRRSPNVIGLNRMGAQIDVSITLANLQIFFGNLSAKARHPCAYALLPEAARYQTNSFSTVEKCLHHRHRYEHIAETSAYR